MAQLREKIENAMRSRKARRILLGVGLAVFALAGAGLYLHWRAGTPEYAVGRLNEAVATDNREDLERLVDFAGLSDNLAAAIVAARPEGGDDARARYRDAARSKLLAVFAGSGEGGAAAERKEEEKGGSPDVPPGQAVPLEDEVFDILNKPTPILPADLIEQLKARPLTIQARDENTAILASTVEHPRLGLSFALRLAMRRTDQGWRVIGFGNGGQLVGEFLGRIEEMKAMAAQAFDEENARQSLLMSTYYHIGECRPVLFPPDADGVVRLRITLTGSNMGERDVLSSGSICDLSDVNGNKLASLRLENTRAVKPGKTFEHGWFYTFEDRLPEVDALVAAGEIRCTATPTTVAFGRGTILYIRHMEDLPGVRLE